MNWLFWLLLIVALILLIAPFAGLVTLALRAVFWVAGAILLLIAIVWAVNSLSSGTRTTSTMP